MIYNRGILTFLLLLYILQSTLKFNAKVEE